ncbi:noncanonical pyrimidine nucleotidase, YjjG family [Paenibacillus lycopersici]|uniref:Noncanonical pyrimidine nucleotidase, YjjG family n=1 Tax=Paenibacillus lycopersici TaxID=2704462 RepID=A0A6C0FY10_9BACL|nr:YjjG family noncanonical pyrimidine nucleotidase [Paenibacillus lycopersici]QHT61988.1 noncanonical pyrimidine nucleotidase, YjjG family [Paenibacillus lycopersici]
MTAYKAILFDLDNTLLDYDTSERESMQRTIRDHGLTDREGLTWELFWTSFAPINWTYWSERMERKLHISDVLDYSFRDTLVQLGFDGALSKALAKTYWELFCSSCLLMDGAEELLPGLHGSYELGIISNGIGEAQRRRLAIGGISHYFPHLFISDEVGVGKPHRLIFDKAVDALDAERSEILFVGDSLTDDYAGARAAGIDFCYYNPHRKPAREGIAPHYIIHELTELNGIMKREEEPQ